MRQSVDVSFVLPFISPTLPCSMMLRFLVFSTALLVLLGCDSAPPMAQISGTVTFKGKPIPAGNVTFTPDVDARGGKLRMFTVKDGKFDSSKESDPGILPGNYDVTIAGYDGVQIPMFYQGKQIFNAVQDKHVVTEGKSTKDFSVPDSAGVNVKVFQTADF